MKTLKAILINLLSYAVVTIMIVSGLNIYVNLVERSGEESLWKNYTTEFEKYVEEKYSSLHPILRYFKKGAAEKEFTKIFVNKYGKIPEKTSPAKVAQDRKERYLRLYFYLLTPLWIIISILVLIIKRGFFRARVIITLITATWIILTTYIPALAGKEMRLINTLVLILVPAGIAWALIRMFEEKRS